MGAALNVHEGPQSISFRYGNMTPLQKGMIVSNEPGYYEDHSFGIRIEVFIQPGIWEMSLYTKLAHIFFALLKVCLSLEVILPVRVSDLLSFICPQNLLSVKEANTPTRFGGIDYLGFEKLTFFPIQV